MRANHCAAGKGGTPSLFRIACAWPALPEHNRYVKSATMATDRMRALEDGIKQFIKPEMIAQSFSYDSSTRTFRRPCRECTQIVNFQAGVRTMAGKFTVNLG